MFVLDDFSDVIAVFAQSTEIYFAIEKQVLKNLINNKLVQCKLEQIKYLDFKLALK